MSYENLFSLTTVAGRHYLAIEDTRLDECLSFLRGEYGVSEVLGEDGALPSTA